MANSNGWISLHRKIQDHWLWHDAEKLKWWIDILICANVSDRKVNVGLDIIECKRGQVIRSLQGWADRWRVSKGCARNFLTLLFKDGMITQESLTKTTRITICNYDTYQQVTHEQKTTEKRSVNDWKTRRDPNNNINKENNAEQVKKEQKEKLNITESLFATGEEKELFNLVKNIYLDFYEKKCGSGEYYFRPIDGKKIKSILKQLLFKMREKEKSSGQKERENFTGQEIRDATLYLLNKGYDTADDWLKANFTLTNIDTKFNSIFTAIKNEGTIKRNGNHHNSNESVVAEILNRVNS